jgi:hypothetical protein
MQRRSCPAPLDGPEKTSAYLRHFGFKRSWYFSKWITFGLPILVFSLFFLFIIRFWIYDSSENKSSTDFWTNFLSPVVTFGLLVGGLWQWQTARNEVSMDKYYERLNIANQWWKASTPVRKMMSALSPRSENPEVTMYVCLELDNLEYVVEKYRIGYIDDEQACRGLCAFQIRCLEAAEFRHIARRRVYAGDYTSRTATVVSEVCNAVERRAERQRTDSVVSGKTEANQTVLATTAIHAADSSSLPPPSPNGKRKGSVASEPGSPKDSSAGLSSSVASPSPKSSLQQRAEDLVRFLEALRQTPGSPQGYGDPLRGNGSDLPADSPPPPNPASR